MFHLSGDVADVDLTPRVLKDTVSRLTSGYNRIPFFWPGLQTGLFVLFPLTRSLYLPPTHTQTEY